MARIKYNLDDIADSFVVMEPGKYAARVLECEEGESSTGNPMLTWTWEIVDGEYQGREVKSFTSLQEHALFGLKQHLEAFGLSGEVDFDTERLVGKRALLTISKSKMRSRKTGEEMDVNRVENVAALPKAGAGKTSTKKRKPADDDDDEDVPF